MFRQDGAEVPHAVVIKSMLTDAAGVLGNAVRSGMIPGIALIES